MPARQNGVFLRAARSRKEPMPPVDAPRPVTASWLMNVAQHYLTRYAATRAQVAALLKRKARKRTGAPPDAAALALIEATLDSLARARLIDDRLFAQGRTQTLKRKGYSAGAARAALAAKGVERELAGEAVADAGFDEVEQARAAARRLRIGPYAREGGPARDPAMDAARLARRGFSIAAVRAALGGGEEGR